MIVRVCARLCVSVRACTCLCVILCACTCLAIRVRAFACVLVRVLRAVRACVCVLCAFVCAYMWRVCAETRADYAHTYVSACVTNTNTIFSCWYVGPVEGHQRMQCEMRRRTEAPKPNLQFPDVSVRLFNALAHYNTV